MLFVSFVQSSFVGAIAIGDLIKSTLGPKGMVCGDNVFFGLEPSIIYLKTKIPMQFVASMLCQSLTELLLL